MKTKTLGSPAIGTALESSAVGLGCMGFSHAYGAPTPDDEAISLIRLAHERGVTLFDTAETYGTPENPHCNEVLVARALRPVRDEVTIVTKFGIHFDYEHERPPYTLHLDSKPETIRASCEGSLARMGDDHIDLYLQHRIDPAVEPEEVAGTMADLIREGKVVRWGISEASEDYLRRAHAVCPVSAVQNRYSMMARWHEALFPTLEKLGVGLLAFSPLANGFLAGTTRPGDQAGFDAASGDYRASMPQFSDEAVEKNRALVELLRNFAQAHDATPAQVSLAWMICKRPWIVPIPGSRSVTRICENAGAGDLVLTPEEIRAIDDALATMEMSAVFGGSPTS